MKFAQVDKSQACITPKTTEIEIHHFGWSAVSPMSAARARTTIIINRKNNQINEDKLIPPRHSITHPIQNPLKANFRRYNETKEYHS